MVKKFDYDVIIIGAGGAGITAAFTANGFKQKVLIVEKNKIGGECTHYGCVPSKALIKAAKISNNVKKMNKYNLNIDYKMNSTDPLTYVRKIVDRVYEEEKPHIFEEKGISVIKGHALFINPNTIEVNNKQITAKSFIIATGTRPQLPPIEGIHSESLLTNENIFYLDKLPKSIGVIGAGAIGIELAQALNRLGVSIEIFLRGDRVLKKEESEISAKIEEILTKEGIVIHKSINFDKVIKNSIHYTDSKNEKHISSFENILVATGRKANIDNLNLDKIGLIYDKKGIKVDSNLRTNISNIYAAGDICGPFKFSHMAEYEGFISAFNCIFPIKKKTDYSKVLWTTFTDPEISHLGYTEDEARKKFSNIKIYTHEYKHLDRAITDSEEGFIKVICHKGKIIGAHIIGARAGELIHELQLLRQFNIPIRKTANMIYAYPTYSDIIRKIGKKAYIDYLTDNWIMNLFNKNK